MAQANRRSGRLGWLGIVSLLVVTGASVAVAQETQLGGKIQSGSQITISADETVDGDLYASGGRVIVEGSVDGDLIVAAGQVTVSGQVERRPHGLGRGSRNLGRGRGRREGGRRTVNSERVDRRRPVHRLGADHYLRFGRGGRGSRVREWSDGDERHGRR